MSKVESLMGSGTLQPLKTGLFGSAKAVEVKYQFQLTTEEDGRGVINGFLRTEEKNKLSSNTGYLLVLEDRRKCKLTTGRAVANLKGIVTYSVSGETTS